MQKRITQVSFCDLHSALCIREASWYRANDKIGRVSWFDDFIGRFSRATKTRTQNLANSIDGLTSRLDCTEASVIGPLVSEHWADLHSECRRSVNRYRGGAAARHCLLPQAIGDCRDLDSTPAADKPTHKQHASSLSMLTNRADNVSVITRSEVYFWLPQM